MKLKKLRSNKLIEVPIKKYLVKWDEPCRSKFQYNVKQWFKPYWRGHICLEEFMIPGSRLRVDLVNLNKRILVEINGVQHDEFNEHFHRNSRLQFLGQITRDQAKKDWAEANNFRVIEILPEDLPLSREFFREKYGIEIL